MRKRFDLQMKIGQTPISEIYINPKSKNSLDQLVASLKEIYCNEEYNEKIFNIIEGYMPKVDNRNGRPGMNLWCRAYFPEKQKAKKPTVFCRLWWRAASMTRRGAFWRFGIVICPSFFRKSRNCSLMEYGGPDGELGASLRYLSQRYSMPYPELQGLLTDIGVEELGHIGYQCDYAASQWYPVQRNALTAKRKNPGAV